MVHSSDCKIGCVGNSRLTINLKLWKRLHDFIQRVPEVRISYDQSVGIRCSQGCTLLFLLNFFFYPDEQQALLLVTTNSK